MELRQKPCSFHYLLFFKDKQSKQVRKNIIVYNLLSIKCFYVRSFLPNTIPFLKKAK